MEWSVQQLARLAGTTSRTLRHYDAVGLLKPSRTGGNGYRYYNHAALLRLQRILLLRELGLGLPAIAGALAHEEQAERALAGHLRWLVQEQDRLSRQIASVRRTLEAVRTGEDIMAEAMFDGFDHTHHQAEVEERWGGEAYARADAWWRGMGRADKDAWTRAAEELGADWRAAAESGAAPDSPAARDLAARQVRWLAAIPGTPAADGGAGLRAYVIGLGELYVADPRFAAHYGGEGGAAFVRDALQQFVDGQS